MGEGMKPESTWLPTVDGLRALACLSLVLLHAQLIAPLTQHPDDPTFSALRQHPIAGIHSFLGCQVDALLVLSGFLLTRALIIKLYIDDRKSLPSLTWVVGTIAKRALRLWPTLFALLLLQAILGDTTAQSHHGAHIWQVLSFTYNYTNFRENLTLSTAPTWSICVDFQLCAAATMALWSCRRVTSTKSAFRCLVIPLLSSLFFISFIIRYIKWDMKDMNLLATTYGCTFWRITPRHVWRYIKAEYNFDPLAHPLSSGVVDDGVSPLIGSDSRYIFKYAETMYNPTQMRFGPFVLGMLLAMIYDCGECEDSPAPGKQTGMKIVTLRVGKLVCTAYCAFIFMVSMKAPTADFSYTQSLIATVFMRNMFALSIAILLSMTLAPKTSVWFSPGVYNFLAWRGWRVISTESYGINMLHYRILVEIVMRRLPLLDNKITFLYIWKVFAAAISVSYILARLQRTYFEETVQRLVLGAVPLANKKLKTP